MAHRLSGTRPSRRRLTAILIAATLGGLTAATGTASAQGPAAQLTSVPPFVILQNALNLGTLYRSTVVQVDYRSANAAVYMVRGVEGLLVRLSVGTFSMIGPELDDPIKLTTTNTQCAFSLDGGATWSLFHSGTLRQVTIFPDVPGDRTQSDILVRVGVTAACGILQRRGDYKGGLTLQAEYLPADAWGLRYQ